MMGVSRWEWAVGVFSFCLLALGQSWTRTTGAAHHMDVLFVQHTHDPAAAVTIVLFVACGVVALGVWATNRAPLDFALESAAEVGVVTAVLALATGMLRSKQMWGLYWSWEPTLTTLVVMVLSWLGLQVVRSATSAKLRAVAASSFAIVAVPMAIATHVCLSVWKSMHRVGGPVRRLEPDAMVLGLNALAWICLTCWFVLLRYRLAESRSDARVCA